MPASEVTLTMPSAPRATPYLWGLVALVIIIATALVLLAMGREPICKCGTIKLWHGVVVSAENSQHISDWYTPSHVIHGFVFYGALWGLSRLTGWNISFGARLCAALLLECGWEIAENTDTVINRYREATIALDYFGDSVLNSVCDVVAMIVGFWLAARLPVVVTIVAALAMELFTGWMIRDNLTLNVIMLLWPLEAIKAWQSSVWRVPGVMAGLVVPATPIGGAAPFASGSAGRARG